MKSQPKIPKPKPRTFITRTRGLILEFQPSKSGYKSVEMRTHCIITEAPTRTACIIATTNILDSKTDDEIEAAVQLKLNRNRIKKRFKSSIYQKHFQKIFKTNIERFIDATMLGFTGIYCFDIVRLDSYIKTPYGTSCNEHIKKKYGATALKLISNLLK